MAVKGYCKICMALAGGVVSTLLLSVTGQAASGPVAVAPGQSVETEVNSGGMQVTARIGAGYLQGESNEFVYWPDQNNHKASQLTWEIDNLFMLGLGGSVTVNDWLIFNADGWFKASDGSGSMDDYDWLVPGLDWTDWSTHEDTDVTGGSIIDINAQIPFYQSGNMVISGYLGYKRDSFEWEARGGNYTYSVNGFRDSTGSFPAGELGITYEQTFDVPYIGVGMVGDYGQWQFQGRFIFSPLVSGEAIDHHHMRNLVTVDDFSGESMMSFDIAGSYAVSEATLIKLAFAYQSYDTMQGDSEWQFNDIGVVQNIADGAGADHDSSMFSLSVVYRF